MSGARIPFNWPYLVGRELDYMKEALQRRHISGDGHFTRRCRDLLRDLLGAADVLLTTSCTDALEMGALLLDLKPGDEVVVPSFAFVSTVNAFVLHGARPVFADVRPDTLNLDESAWTERITPRTRAVVPLHYAGVGCEMDAILAAAGRRGVAVLEDNAHGLFGKYRGRWLGTMGALGMLSFHETKNISCGEGGALVINDARFRERAQVLRAKGTNRAKFLRGEVDKYTWVDVGSSYLPSDLLAAFLFAQLEGWESIQSRRRCIAERYRAGLESWAKDRGVRLPAVPPTCESSHHLFFLLMPEAAAQESLIRLLRSRGIDAVFHYQPLHLSEMGRRYGGREGDCPVTEDASQRLVRLPFYNDLSEAAQDEVIDAVRGWR